jgi:ADP-ribosylglycohydrolase
MKLGDIRYCLRTLASFNLSITKMRHLLLTKFQGALIGGNLIYLDRYQIAPNQLIIDTTPALIEGINALVDRGKFEPEDWSQRVNPALKNSASQSLVTMLPLMLFFHHDRLKLREVIINISHGWQLDWETCSSTVAIGYIVARSLTESFHLRTIIPQLLDEMTNLHPLIFQELSAIDRSLAGSMSLHQIDRRLTTEHPIVAATMLAIYGFLSTPEDFSLATRRIARLDRVSPLTCALTGILAGTHNSLAGIPLNGYAATQDKAQWQSLAANLLNTWAGVDLQHAPPSNLPLAVAAPNVIQRR